MFAFILAAPSSFEGLHYHNPLALCRGRCAIYGAGLQLSQRSSWAHVDMRCQILAFAFHCRAAQTQQKATFDLLCLDFHCISAGLAGTTLKKNSNLSHRIHHQYLLSQVEFHWCVVELLKFAQRLYLFPNFYEGLQNRSVFFLLCISEFSCLPRKQNRHFQKIGHPTHNIQLSCLKWKV